MKEFDYIYVSWRRGQGHSRFVIGVLKKHQDGTFTFSYDNVVVAHAQKEGFAPYTEFPSLQSTYNGSVLDVFAQRLMKSERSDVQAFYELWEIDPVYKTDKFYLLVIRKDCCLPIILKFLADYIPSPGLHFLTDVAHLTELQLPANTVKVSDILTYKLDNNNVHDQHAVKLYKGDQEVGSVKQIHCRLFHKVEEGKLRLTVKAVDQMATIQTDFPEGGGAVKIDVKFDYYVYYD